MNADHHHGDAQDYHHPAVIDVSPDASVNIVELFKLSVLLILLSGVVSRVPRLRRIRGRCIFNTKQFSLYYLLRPPLRAPPG
jgi:hypothetical protein